MLATRLAFRSAFSAAPLVSARFQGPLCITLAVLPRKDELAVLPRMSAMALPWQRVLYNLMKDRSMPCKAQKEPMNTS